MPLADAGGLFGVGIVLIAYAGAALGRLDPQRPLSCLINLVGAILILISLAYDFNLSAVAMEGAWALVSLVGLVRSILKLRSARSRPAT